MRFPCGHATNEQNSCQRALTPAWPSAPADLEWKLTYVGSAETDEHDQVLDSVLVGPVAVGSYRFIFQARPHFVHNMSSSVG